MTAPAATSQGELQQLAQVMAGELDGDAKALAESVYGARTPGSAAVGDEEYTALVSRNWDDAGWRVRAAQANPGAFLKAARALGGVLPGEPGHSQTPVPLQPAVPIQPPAPVPPGPAPIETSDTSPAGG